MQALHDWTLSAAAEVLGCDAPLSDAPFTNVNTDTRTIVQGDLFVALVGENFDGHDYVEQAKDNGAVGAIVSRQVDSSLTQLKVDDTRIALGNLASAHRACFKNPIIGLTGSNGKTTVKELLKAILQTCGKVLATNGNFNNDIGLPLTLFRLKLDEDFAVIEMGANHPGEIAYLTNIAKPNVAILNNAGAAHLEGFGSIEGVARAKGEIFEQLGSEGIAIVNMDDRYADYWLGITTHCERIGFGINNEADVRASEISNEAHGMRFVLSHDKQSVVINLPLFGQHNVMNALAASSAAIALGVSLEKIATALDGFIAVKGRLQARKASCGALVFDDTYNANPGSMRAGIDVLVSQQGNSVLVIGDMLEGGEHSKQAHYEIGEYAKRQGVGQLFAYGPDSEEAVKGFGQNGRHYKTHESLIDDLLPVVDQQSVVLVKGSRGMRMECVVEALTDSERRS